METTVTLEFTAETHKQLESLEHQLKHIHGIQVLLVLPRDETAPALISLGIGKKGEQAEQAIPQIAQLLSDFLHDPERMSQKVELVTIEGENVDITSLTSEEMQRIIKDAHDNQ